MTRKDYITAANLVKEFESEGSFSRKHDKRNVIIFLCEFFQKDNPKFNRNLFIKSCDENVYDWE